MKMLRKIKNVMKPRCSRCGNRFYCLSDHVKELVSLRPLNGYQASYDSFSHLCSECWIEIKKVPCSLCNKKFDIFKTKRADLLKNYKGHGILNNKVSNAKQVCPRCYENLRHSKCSNCSKSFRAQDNYKEKSKRKVETLFKPYHVDYSSYSPKGPCICQECYQECVKSCREIRVGLNQSWVKGTRSEFIKGYRIVKSLGRIDYKGTACSEPAEVEKSLKLYSVQLGGNGFIKFYWEKHVKQNSRSVLAGYSKNGNPYYKTEYNSKKWFTGYATAVILEPSRSGRRSSSATRGR